MDYSRNKDKLIQESKRLFEHAFEAEYDQRREMLDDLRFSYAIEQWEDKDRQEREREGRPALTIDRIGDTVRKVMGSMRQNRPSIKVIPAEGGDVETSEVINDLVREIENASKARSVYMTAANHQVRMGYGVIGVVGVENSTDAWTQDLRVRRYPNPFAVFFDPEAIEQDKSDGDFCFISEWCSEPKFRKRWPKAKWTGSGNNGGEIGERQALWYSDKKARIIKVWRKMPCEKNIILLSDGRTLEREKLSDSELMQIETGELSITREKKVKGHEVIRFIMTENEIIEGVDVWPGKFIPCVPVYGEEINIEGKTTYRGITRTAKDPQRLYNYARTTNAEILMEQPRAPYLIGTSQLPKELREVWKGANQGKKPFLPYDDTVNPSVPSRQPPPTISAGYTQEAQIASDDLQRATGIFDPSLGARSNEVSGVAIAARQQGSDTGTYIFPDNLSVALEQVGRILVELIPHFYDTERIIRVRGEDDGEREVVINQATIGENGLPTIKHDLSRGKYDVRVTTGPSYATQRMEARESMIGFVQAIPGAAPLVGDLIAKNMDWPGSEEFAKRLKTLVPPEAMGDEEQDPEKQQMMQALQQAEQLIAELQGGIETQKTQSEIAQKVADARKKNAEADAQLIENAAVESGLIQLG